MYLTEVIKKLLPTAIYYGMSITEFYNSTHSEIMIYILARKNAEKNQVKTQLLMNKELVTMFGASMNGKNYDVMKMHPELFAEELKPKPRNWEQEKLSILRVLHSS